MVSLVCSTAYPTTSISILLTGYDTSTKKDNYRHPQHTRETVHSYSEQSNSKHLTSVVVSRFASIPSGPRAVAPFPERESAPLLGVLCLSQRSRKSKSQKFIVSRQPRTCLTCYDKFNRNKPRDSVPFKHFPRHSRPRPSAARRCHPTSCWLLRPLLYALRSPLPPMATNLHGTGPPVNCTPSRLTY